MTVIINICMIFRYIQDHTDTYHLLYDGPGSLFKSTVFEHFFRWRKKNNWLCRLLSFPAVPFVAGCPPGLLPVFSLLFVIFLRRTAFEEGIEEFS